MRALRQANKKLADEIRGVNETLSSTIATLQNQMTAAMMTAVAKKQELEGKLAQSEETVRLLRSQLIEQDD
jgi:hypothetical protein